MATLSAAEASALTDYDAVQAGLPRHVRATLIVQIEGRPESTNFLASLQFQPRAHARPWSSVTIDGHLLRVGCVTHRLNAYQLQATELVRQLQEAKTMAARITLWPHIMQLAHAPRSAQVELRGYIPAITVQESSYARIIAHRGQALPVPVLPSQRTLQRGFILHEGTLMSWADCYRHGYIPEVVQAPRHAYVRLTPDLIDALTLLHQAVCETGIKSPAKAYQAAQESLPASHRHLILPA